MNAKLATNVSFFSQKRKRTARSLQEIKMAIILKLK